MSIQDTIDKYLSKEGKHLRHITCIGEAGSASVPRNCFVQFRKCTIGSLSVASGSVVVIEESSLGELTQTGGMLTLDRVIISGQIALSGTKATQKLCSASQAIVLTDGAVLDGVGNTRQGGAIGVMAINSSVTLRKDTFSGIETCFEFAEHSSGSLYECVILGTLIGVRASESQVEIMGGELNGHDQWALSSRRSKILISTVKPTIHGGTIAIRAEDASEVRITNCTRVLGDEFGIYASEGSRVEVSRFDKIEASGNAAIFIDSEANVSCMFGNKVFSSGSDAIIMKGGTFTARQVNEITSPAANGLRTSRSRITLQQIKTEVRGYGANGILSGEGDIYDISDCPLIQGDAGHGIASGNHCQFALRSVDVVKGVSGDGMSLGDSCTLEQTRGGLVEGVLGSGIRLGSSGNLSLQHVTKIRGAQRDGITVGNTTTVRCLDSNNIEGVMRDGVNAGSGCDLEFVDFGKVQGTLGTGVVAVASRVTLRRGKELRGIVGAGVRLSGSGNFMVLDNILAIRGDDGNGVMLSGGELLVTDCRLIRGSTSGFRIVDGVTAKIRRCTAIHGADTAGVAVEGGSSLDMSVVDDLAGVSKGGIYLLNAEATISSVKSIAGSPDAIVLIGASRLQASNCHLLQNLSSEGGADCHLFVVRIEGSVTVEGGSFSADTVEVIVNQSYSDCSVTLSRVNATGSIALIGSSLTAQSVSSQISIALSNSAAQLLSCGSPSLAIVGSTTVEVGCEFADVAHASGSRVAVQLGTVYTENR